MALPGSKLTAAKPPPEEPRTRWHSMKGPYRQLFKEDNIPHVEKWYNCIASYKQRSSFRHCAKQIMSIPDSSIMLPDAPVTGQEPLEWHRAKHMVLLYGSVLSSEGGKRAYTWIATKATAPELDLLREVMSAIEGVLAIQTATKSQFVVRPVAEPPKRDRNRIKIDWNSTAAFDDLRDRRDNPMDRKAAASLPGVIIPPTDPSQPKKKGAIRPRGVNLSDEEAARQDAEGGMLSKIREKHKLMDSSDGAFELLPDGSTLYRSRAMIQPKHLQTQPNRIVATFRAADTSNWMPTMKEHIKNHGRVPYSRMDPDKHPAVSRITASTLLCVPNQPPLKRHALPPMSA